MTTEVFGMPAIRSSHDWSTTTDVNRASLLGR
jgi:hypothetical protein